MKTFDDLNISYDIRTYIEQIMGRISSKNLPIEALILFGSYAREDVTIKSDLDIAVVVKPGELNRKHQGIIVNIPVELDIPIDVDFFFTTKKALAHPTGVFDTNKYIKEEGVMLWQQ